MRLASINPLIEVIERACPLFVPLAEEGWADTDVARAVAEQYLGDLQRKGYRRTRVRLHALSDFA